MEQINGRVLEYGDNINTDLIAPSQYGPCEIEVQLMHAMEGVDPDFSRKVQKGDIIVAGKNFGCGSSRETAPNVLKQSGISAVIAESFARIFFRNAINIGLPVLTTAEIDKISENDVLSVDPLSGRIYNTSTGETISSNKLPEFIMELLNDGGLIEHTKKQYNKT